MSTSSQLENLQRASEYYWNNRAKISANRRRKYYANRSKVIERNRKYAAKNSDKLKSARKIWVNKNQSHLRDYLSNRYRDNRDKNLVAMAEYRTKNRLNLRATARAHSLLLTDRYIREQLSKYSDKSMWEWTRSEVDAKRGQITISRDRKISDDAAFNIRKIYNGDRNSTIFTLAKKFNTSPTNVHGIIQNKLHIDPNYHQSRFGRICETSTSVLKMINAAHLLVEFTSL